MNKKVLILILIVVICTLFISTSYLAANLFKEGKIVYLEQSANNSYDLIEEKINIEEIVEEITSGETIFEEDNIYSGDAILDEEPEEKIIEVPEAKKTTSEAPKTTTKNTTTKTNATTKTTTKTQSIMPYYIKVNRTQNVVNIYSKDASGDYTVPVKAMICSIGTSTPKAGSKYKITTYRREWNALKGNVYGQYAVQIIGNILFHSVPYTAKDKSTLEYWEYDKLGTKASLGCIRLTVADAKWIYDNVGAGTWVEFYEDENPGPLGKPNASIISGNEEFRNWDPTDYVEGNPWHTPIEVIAPIEPEEILENEDLNAITEPLDPITQTTEEPILEVSVEVIDEAKDINSGETTTLESNEVIEEPASIESNETKTNTTEEEKAEEINTVITDTDSGEKTSNKKSKKKRG